MRQLLSDFYLPHSIGRIFSGVFANEFYHWEQSPNKVHQGILRLRGRLQERGLPLVVEQRNAFYALKTNGAISIRLTLSDDIINDPLDRLKNRFKEEFTAGDARYSFAYQRQRRTECSIKRC